jgi:polyhydroxyalkanoate synthesis regulator phasin
MKSNFEKMSVPELRAYVLTHRDDIDAIRALFHHPSLKWKTMPPLATVEGMPIEENIRRGEEALRRRVERTPEGTRSYPADIREAAREKPRELEERIQQKIEEEQSNFKKNSMTTVTQEEIEQFREQLAGNSKALADLEVIEYCGGELERAARVLSRRADIEEVRAGANWQLGLQKARKIVCDGKFKEGLVPGLIGALIGTFTASGSPVLAAVATPTAIYIAQVGIDAFCKVPQSASEDRKNPS